MGQSWLAELELQVMEALGGRREFPLAFPVPPLSSDEIREATESVGRLSLKIEEVEYRPGGAGSTAELVVKRASTDPYPPPGLEAYPRLL